MREESLKPHRRTSAELVAEARRFFGVPPVNDLERAEALDAMDQDVTSWESEFLETVLVSLRKGHGLTQKQKDVLDEMTRKYNP